MANPLKKLLGDLPAPGKSVTTVSVKKLPKGSNPLSFLAGDPESDEGSDEGDEDSTKAKSLRAVRALREALKAGDDEAAAAAFHDAVEACQEGGYEHEEEEEGEDEGDAFGGH